MSVKILTDSTSDILPQEARSMDITVVPLHVLFGDQSFRDNLDITHEEFYARLTVSKKLPTTTQLTPEAFLPDFQAAKAAGDSLVCVLLASKLSGTLQSAHIAKEMCGYDGIHIVDSGQATVGIRILVDLACLLRQEGRSAGEIVRELERVKSRVRLYAMVDTLEYLHRGGRLPAAVTVVGSLLRVKPLITLRDGRLSVVGKGIGAKAALHELLTLPGDPLPIDSRLPLYYGYTADRTLCDQLMVLANQKFHPRRTLCCSVGAVIGTHVGPGAVVLAYLEQD